MTDTPESPNQPTTSGENIASHIFLPGSAPHIDLAARIDGAINAAITRINPSPDMDNLIEKLADAASNAEEMKREARTEDFPVELGINNLIEDQK